MVQTWYEQTTMAQPAVPVATMLLVPLVAVAARKEEVVEVAEREEECVEAAAVEKEEDAKERMAREEVEQEDQADNQQALKGTKS